MSANYEIPSDAVRYILLQRTETQDWLKEIRYTLPKGRALHNLIYNKFLYRFEASFREEEIKQEYLSQLREEFEQIQPFLPERVDSILDVGCGVGGINLYLAEHYRDHLPELYLYDKTEISEEVYYQFHEDPAFYNSLEVAGELLSTNGINSSRVHLRDADRFELTELHEIDLCVSFLSWAFHYPLDTYLEDVLECLSGSGSLILDFRQDAADFETCREHFEAAEIIADTEKYRRAIFHRPQPLPAREREPVGV